MADHGEFKCKAFIGVSLGCRLILTLCLCFYFRYADTFWNAPLPPSGKNEREKEKTRNIIVWKNTYIFEVTACPQTWKSEWFVSFSFLLL